MSSPAHSVTSVARPSGLWSRLALRWVAGITHGRLTLTFPNGAVHVAEGAAPGPEAALTIHRNRAFRRVMLRGDVGLSEGFMEGDWSTPDLRAMLAFGYANEAALAGPMSASAGFGSLLRAWQRFRDNSRAGSRRNIAYHYDLGNEFYRLWLDPTLTYSSAIFSSPAQPLEDAQTAKYRRIAEQLALRPEHHVLEIGCGWGGFAAFAARTVGCRVTAITISREQAALATERMVREGVADRVDVRIVDYRDVEGSFDRIVSIEMLEAVGEKHWPSYFATLKHRLAPDGQAMVQVITVPDDRFPTYRNSVDFIQRYIFPGGLLLAPGIMARESDRAGLRVADSFFFGRSYAETLRQWHERFQAAWPAIQPLGFDERFRRMWSYYLCGCEASFVAGACDVGQFQIVHR